MTDKCLTRFSCFVALGLVACGSAGADSDTGSTLQGALSESAVGDVGQVSQPIVGGATDSKHVAVLAIALVTRKEEALCSGSLIAPNLVLTARHCVATTASEQVSCGTSTFGSLYPADNLWVSSSTTVGSSNFYPVKEIAVPDSDSELCGSDIALMILNGQFRETSVAPIAPRLDQPAKRGESITAVGYGDALTAGDPGIRRAVDGIQVLCGPNDCNAPQLLTQREFVGEQGVCDGDSGGPALDTDGRVVGVASRATENCGLAVYSAVSPWRDWIVSVAEHAQDLGTYDTQGWLASEEDSLDSAAPAVTGPIANNDTPMASSGDTPSRIEPGTSASPARSSSGCSIGAGIGADIGGRGSVLSASAVSRNAQRAAWLTAITLAGAMVLRRPRRLARARRRD
jgi:hypothetical protein